MDKQINRKSFVDGLTNRSTNHNNRTKFFSTQSLPKNTTTTNTNKQHVTTMMLSSTSTSSATDYCGEKFRLRIERLENELIRYDKILNMYIERIEELENKLKTYENDQYRNQVLKLLQNSNTNTNINTNKCLPIHSISLAQFLQNSAAASSSNINNNSISGGNNRNSIIYNEQQQLTTANRKIKIPEKNNSKWSRITKLFKSRPTLETLKQNNIYKNEVCFDTELDKVVKHDQYATIPKIVVECICLIENKAQLLPTDGLYRMSGNYVDIQKIRYLIDNNDYDCLKNIQDIHTLIGILKLFFREIKSPLIKISEIHAFIGSGREWNAGTITHKIETLKKLIQSLPEQNRDTLCYFLKHLCRLTHMPLQFVNATSLAVSLTPTIFHFTVSDTRDLHKTLKETEILTNCLEIFIEYQSRIFETKTKSLSKTLTRCISYPCLT